MTVAAAAQRTGSPTLDALPPPPDGCSGWPWTADATPATAIDASISTEWPRVTIITPSFNQGATLEQTIRSVLLQQYPNLEYMVIDGGSTDASPAIIQQYAPFLTYWRSAPDHGQADAINRGLARATGDIVNWLCSDDLLEPGAVQAVARAFLDQPDADVVVGDCRRIDAEGRPRSLFRADITSIDLLPVKHLIPQPSCFVRRAALDRGDDLPPLDPTLTFAMDRELWCSLRARGARWSYIPQTLSRFRVTSQAKSSRGGWAIFNEREHILRQYAPHMAALMRWYRHLHIPLVHSRHASDRTLPARLARWVDATLAGVLSLCYGRATVCNLDWYEQLKLDESERR